MFSLPVTSNTMTARPELLWITSHNDTENFIVKSRDKARLSKICRNTGKAYTTQKGKSIPQKTYYVDDCTCPKKCHQFFSLTERRNLFDAFYKLANFDFQNAMIWNSVKVIKSRKYIAKQFSRRENTRLYYLNCNGSDIQVCSRFFQKTLRVSNGRITRVLKTKSDGAQSTPPIDRRGKKCSSTWTGSGSLL